ncbi:MAG: DUF89 family protein [Candidatus Aminicenantes bacterium]|nr:DUF89 family protein [Candidatus Aminicenantes bacterium]
MKAYLDCYPCFFKQALNTARMLQMSEEKTLEILNELGKKLPGIPFGASPPEIGREVYRLVTCLTKVSDPFKKIKTDCIHQALNLYQDLKSRVAGSKDRLETAVRLAIAGNVIDFGANSSFDLNRDIEDILFQEFAINHYASFREALNKTDHVLFLGDNAGETVFDRLLIEELGKHVVYAVREKPVINDAVEEDAVLSGIDKVAEIVSSGCDAPGTILHLCSNTFRDRFLSAALIISKGQGNYEGLSEEKAPLFFLLKAKCGIIARDLGVAKGDIILKKA